MTFSAASDSEPVAPVDVAIVGGGIAGLYSAWRLKQKHPGWRIVVYERDDRTGGRLLTATPPQMPSVRAELGGMRYLSTHRLVHSLANHLRLDVLDFPVSEPDNIAYLRGVKLLRRQLTDPALPYRLVGDERGKTIGALMSDAIERIVPGITRLTRAQQMQRVREVSYRERPLYQWGFWNALYRAMSPEAYQLVVDASGYDTTVSNWNAADAIPWFLADFGASVKYLYPRQGMQALPDGVRELFKSLRGEIVMGRTVARVARTTHGVQLAFTDNSVVDAKHLILALPRRSLELIDLQRAFGDDMPRIRAMIESVAPQPLFKLLACYDAPWWRDLKIKHGQTTTDTPLRQTYYFQTEGEQPGADPRNTRSLLMATYNDGRSLKYWIGMLRERRAAEARAAEARAAEAPGDDAWERHRVDSASPMLDEIHYLLSLVHGTKVPPPYAAAFYDWSVDPYGGGYNLWKIHAKSWEISRAMIRPVAGLPLYICGEAYSTDQGWVEGALETAEDVLERGFALESPPWLLPVIDDEAPQTGDSATLRL